VEKVEAAIGKNDLFPFGFRLGRNRFQRLALLHFFSHGSWVTWTMIVFKASVSYDSPEPARANRKLKPS
jgi:hypothetical protein